MLERAEYLRDHSKVMADPLSDIVTMAGAQCHISARLIAGSPWALRYPPPQQIKFMAIVKGGCFLCPDEQETPRWIAAGDVLMLSGPRPYTLASDLDTPPRDATEVFADLTAKLARTGDGDDFLAIGGHVVLDRERGWILADVLPPWIHVDGNAPEASTMRVFLDQMVEEAASDRPGSALMSAQLSQLLFVQTMRSYLSTFRPLAAGWARVLGDQRIAPALRLMHREPDRPWCLEDLAKAVAMSRTSFAVRFKAAAGVAPLTYLANWRMAVAQQRLKTTPTPVATLALSLGYASESAFSNAFKRATGMAPSRYRAANAALERAGPQEGRRYPAIC